MMIRIFLLNIFFCVTLSAFSQSFPIKKSEKIIELEGKMYYLHTVSKAQTLYSICKAYEVNISDILKINQKNNPSLSVDEVLKIPYNEKNITTKEPQQDSPQRQHMVQQNETLYSISKKYKVTIDEILKLNNKTTYHVFIGETLLLPPAKESITQKESPQSTKKHIPWKETPQPTQPQPVRKKAVKPISKNYYDQKYFYHYASRGETSYLIAKKYDIKLNKFLRYNKWLKRTNINKGDKVRIPKKYAKEVIYELDIQAREKEIQERIAPKPVTKLDTKEVDAKVPENYYDDSYFYYYAKSGETSYHIAQKFGLKQRKFLRYNKWLKRTHLKPGDKVRIPKKYAKWAIYELDLQRKEREIKERITPPIDTIPDEKEIAEVEPVIDTLPVIPPLEHKTRYNVALLSPITKSETLLKFYQGLLLGLEDYTNQSPIEVTLFTHNLEKDSSRIDSVLNQLLMKEIDVIIGPFDHKSFTQVAMFGNSYNIPVVSLSAMYGNVEFNENVIQLNTGYKTTAMMIANYVTESHPYDKILLTSPDTLINFSQYEDEEMYPEDKTMLIRDEFINALLNETFDHEIDYLTKFQEILSKDSTNVVLIPCVKSSNVSRILANLYAAKGLEKTKIIVYGLPVWQFYEDIDPTFFYKLNIHYFSPFYTNYKDNQIAEFVKEFRQKFMAEPHQTSFRGFDTIWFILSGLEKFGNHFIYNINNASTYSLSANFSFKKYDYGGFENIQVFRVVYKPNYTIDSTLLLMTP